MANAADYLLLDTTQLVNNYKLRTRSILANTFIAKNIAPTYTLTVNITTNLSSVTVTPSAFILRPDEVVTVTVEYDTTELEILPAGALDGALNIAVSADPIVVPQLPTAPPPPPLPSAPKEIISRIEITPSNFTLSEIGETKQYSAVLYVDDVIISNATFSWKLDDNLAEAFTISDAGVVRALKPAINKALVVATCTSPVKYAGTTGLANTAANIPIIINTNVTAAPPETTGNLTVIIRGTPSSIGGNVSVSGISQTITKTTTFNNIQAGTYTITPNVVSVGNENYNPRGGGQIYVGPGEFREIAVDYELQPIPDNNTIGITQIIGPNGQLSDGSSLFVGDRFTVITQTYRNGLPADLGITQINATNTTQGVQMADRGTTPGKTSAVFTVSEPGTITISALGAGGKSVTGTLQAINKANYTIKILRPKTILQNQCTAVTAVVLKDGIETNIPVSIEVTNNMGLVSDTPCEIQQVVRPQPVLQPQPQITFTGGGGGTTSIVDTGAAGTSGGIIPSGEFDQIAYVTQGPNVT